MADFIKHGNQDHEETPRRPYAVPKPKKFSKSWYVLGGLTLAAFAYFGYSGIKLSREQVKIESFHNRQTLETVVDNSSKGVESDEKNSSIGRCRTGPIVISDTNENKEAFEEIDERRKLIGSYSVKEGDNFSSLVNKAIIKVLSPIKPKDRLDLLYGKDSLLSEFAEQNNIIDVNRIEPDQILTLDFSVLRGTSNEFYLEKNLEPKEKEIIVQKGDTLTRIVESYYYEHRVQPTASDLNATIIGVKRDNYNLEDENLIYPGQKIKIIPYSENLADVMSKVFNGHESLTDLLKKQGNENYARTIDQTGERYANNEYSREIKDGLALV